MAKSKLNIWYMIVAFISCIPVVFYKNSFLNERIGYINILALLVLAVTGVNVVINYRTLFRKNITLQSCLLVDYYFCRILLMNV